MTDAPDSDYDNQPEDLAGFEDSPEARADLAEVRRQAKAERKKAEKKRLQDEAKQVTAGFSESAIADSFAAASAGKLAWDNTDKLWFVFENGVWQPDEPGAAFDMIRDYIKLVREAALERGDLAPPAMLKIGFASAVERAVRADKAIRVTWRTWDTHPMLLGVPGGVVDLTSGQHIEADPKLYISKRTAVAPADPGTDMPIWLGFLEEVTGGDANHIGYLQRLIGYFLTGDVTREMFAFWYGEGGRGKGVMVHTLVSIMRDYAVTVPTEFFTLDSRMNKEYYRAEMHGARLVYASETEADSEFDEKELKKISGNEGDIPARSPHGKPFQFRPCCKILLIGNNQPTMKAAGDAMKRRLHLAPFNHPPKVINQTLKLQLEAEYPAILRWMIEGSIQQRLVGLGKSRVVEEAGASYFEQQDGFARWLDERCIIDDQHVLRSPPGKLLKDYKGWCAENAEPGGMTGNHFAELVDRHPILERRKVHGQRLVFGIGLKAPDEPNNQRVSDPEPPEDPFGQSSFP